VVESVDELEVPDCVSLEVASVLLFKSLYHALLDTLLIPDIILPPYAHLFYLSPAIL
jgi:hypothetical protein